MAAAGGAQAVQRPKTSWSCLVQLAGRDGEQQRAIGLSPASTAAAARNANALGFIFMACSSHDLECNCCEDEGNRQLKQLGVAKMKGTAAAP